MTSEQLDEDVMKFIRYLQENGADVTSLHIRVADPDQVVTYGSSETITEALLIAVADRLGYALGVKK